MATYNFIFKASLPIKYKEDLHRLFYFNANQKKYTPKIISAIEHYGNPLETISNNKVSLLLDSSVNGQNLFMLDDESENAVLLGGLIYFRKNDTTIIIAHMAMHEEAALVFKKKSINLTEIFIHKLINTVTRLRGVKEIVLPYSNKKILINK
jgi:hypothetical protein